MKNNIALSNTAHTNLRYLPTTPSTQSLTVETSTAGKELLKTEMKLNALENVMREMYQTLDDLERNRDINTIKSSIYKLKKQLATQLDTERRWSSFQRHFDLVQSDFYKKLKEKYDNLTIVDLELCAYLKMEMNTKEIAHHLNLSIRGIETRKYRLKKKLNLNKEELSSFIAAI